ncbi:hypothetical protein BC828DRAFT_384035 [Blastocladiella britannica]|nr:hypothetical protein BC828DRAFT_384035 [Blastocladiella britannica]
MPEPRRQLHARTLSAPCTELAALAVAGTALLPPRTSRRRVSAAPLSCTDMLPPLPLSRRTSVSSLPSMVAAHPKSHKKLQLLDLPNELLLLIMDHVAPASLSIVAMSLGQLAPPSARPAHAILRFRAANRRLHALAAVVLRPVVAGDCTALAARRASCETHRSKVLAAAEPALAHNRRFLRSVAPAHLRELSALARPVGDLAAVCAAFVALMHPDVAPAAALNPGAAWATTRRLLAHRTTHTWATTLHTATRTSPPPTVAGGLAAARSIIVRSGISYDRMRTVSVVGYRLLIATAAVLQFHEHVARIDAADAHVARLTVREGQAARFAAALDAIPCGSPYVAPAGEVEDFSVLVSAVVALEA